MSSKQAIAILAELIAPIAAQVAAGELDASKVCPAIAAEVQDRTGCSDAEAVAFTKKAVSLLA